MTGSLWNCFALRPCSLSHHYHTLPGGASAASLQYTPSRRPEDAKSMLTLTARGSTLVCRRQILTTKVDPRAVRVQIFLMVVDPSHMYSNESERANEDIYADFKLKKPFGFHNLHKKISASRVKPASPYVGSNFSRHLMSIWKAGRQSCPRQPPPPPQSSEPVMPVQFSIDDSHGLPFASHCLLSCFLVSSKKTWLALMCFSDSLLCDDRSEIIWIIAVLYYALHSSIYCSSTS